MKRLLAGMLCAVLLALFSMPAVGKTEVAHGIFELYDESGESASWLGVAAPVFPGLLATSAGNLPGDTANLSVTDGRYRWDVQEVYAEETFPVAFLTYDSETEPASLEAWPFRSEPGLPSADSIYVLSAAEGGDRLYRTPTAAVPLKWQGLDCMLLTLPTPVAPGSPVLTDGNELAASWWIPVGSCTYGVEPPAEGESSGDSSGASNEKAAQISQTGIDCADLSCCCRRDCFQRMETADAGAGGIRHQGDRTDSFC